MAVTLTTTWQNLSSSPGEYFRGWTSGGYQFNYSAIAQARYNIVNGQPRIELRIVMETDNTGGWSGTNRNYRLHFATETSGPPGDSTTRQDTHSWNVIGYQAYQLYQAGETVNPVYKNVDFGTTHGVHWYYYVGASGTSAVDVWKDVYIPVPTPTLTALDATTNSTDISWLVGDGVGSLNGTGYVYGGTSPSPTTQLFTTNLQYTTFTHSGLDPNTTYYYRARVQAPNGTWGSYCPDLNITTRSGVDNLYGSVNGQTKKITELYGSVNGQTKKITKLYGSVNGQTKRIF